MPPAFREPPCASAEPPGPVVVRAGTFSRDSLPGATLAVQDGRMRVHASTAAVLAALGAGCGASAPSSTPEPSPPAYLTDVVYRRATLLASLVNPGDGYARDRIAHYATGAPGDWDALPEWNPPAELVEASELDLPAGAPTTTLSDRAAPLDTSLKVISIDDPALVALGRQAFERYPVQPAPYFSVALISASAAATYGLWTDATRGVGGLVRARMGDGSVTLAMTCSTCHAAPSPGGIEPGLPNRAVALGAAVLATEPWAPAPIAAWGPGRIDVTTGTGLEPARIPDLRPVALLSYIQQDATLRVVDEATLAIRIETLVIASNEEAVRPPRIVALALAAYVRSLASSLPSYDAAKAAQPAGAAIFESECTGCHVPPALTGEPVPLSQIGTDPTLGESLSRGTGMYRVPSLHGVGTRGPLLHDATLPDVDAMFDPSRLDPGFTDRLHGTGPVQGHRYGLSITDAQRASLLTFLKTL
jgi:cytochrome c5